MTRSSGRRTSLPPRVVVVVVVVALLSSSSARCQAFARHRHAHRRTPPLRSSRTRADLRDPGRNSFFTDATAMPRAGEEGEFERERGRLVRNGDGGPLGQRRRRRYDGANDDSSRNEEKNDDRMPPMHLHQHHRHRHPMDDVDPRYRSTSSYEPKRSTFGSFHGNQRTIRTPPWGPHPPPPPPGYDGPGFPFPPQNHYNGYGEPPQQQRRQQQEQRRQSNGGYPRTPGEYKQHNDFGQQQQQYRQQQRNNGYGQPQHPQMNGLQPQQNGYRQPLQNGGLQPLQNGGLQPQQNGYRQPPQQDGFQRQPQQNGYRRPPQQNGFQRQPQQSGYGQPQQHQNGYGQPQPQQQPQYMEPQQRQRQRRPPQYREPGDAAVPFREGPRCDPPDFPASEPRPRRASEDDFFATRAVKADERKRYDYSGSNLENDRENDYQQHNFHDKVRRQRQQEQEQQQQQSHQVGQPHQLYNAPQKLREHVTPAFVGGDSLRTWSLKSNAIERVEILLKAAKGWPIDANVEVWNGPDDTPQRMKIWTEDGHDRPFRAVLPTPNGPNTVAIRNLDPTMPGSPLAGFVVKNPGEYGQDLVEDSSYASREILSDGFAEKFKFDQRSNHRVESVQIRLSTPGIWPIRARVEILEGPAEDARQVIDVACHDGSDRPFYLILETPPPARGEANPVTVKIVNRNDSLDHPLEARVEPYVVGYGGESGAIDVAGQVIDVDEA